MKSIVRRDTEESYTEYLNRMIRTLRQSHRSYSCFTVFLTKSCEELVSVEWSGRREQSQPFDQRGTSYNAIRWIPFG
jgi:hypothetical protein